MAQSRIVDSQSGDCFPGGKRVGPDGLVVEAPTEDLVVPDQRVENAAAPFGPPLQIEYEIEHLPLFIAASNRVAELNDRQRAADPLVTSIDGASGSQGEA